MTAAVRTDAKTEATRIRDALRRVLAGARVPLSTNDVACRMPPIRRVFTGGWPCPDHPDDGMTRTVGCDNGRHVVEVPCYGPDIYPHLRALERAGEVRRLYAEAHRAVYWRAPHPERDARWAARAAELAATHDWNPTAR